MNLDAKSALKKINTIVLILTEFLLTGGLDMTEPMTKLNFSMPGMGMA